MNLKICVFSGSALPHNKTIASAMGTLAEFANRYGHSVISGGMAHGGMKILGHKVLQAGAKLHTIAPEEFRSYEEAGTPDHPNLTREWCANLHQRLELMITQADAFVAFPGGLGTFHEIMQVWADNQAASYHVGGLRKAKPLLIYSPMAFFESLVWQVQEMEREGYVKPEHVSIPIMAKTLSAFEREVQRICCPA